MWLLLGTTWTTTNDRLCRDGRCCMIRCCHCRCRLVVVVVVVQDFATVATRLIACFGPPRDGYQSLAAPFAGAKVAVLVTRTTLTERTSNIYLLYIYGKCPMTGRTGRLGPTRPDPTDRTRSELAFFLVHTTNTKLASLLLFFWLRFLLWSGGQHRRDAVRDRYS